MGQIYFSRGDLQTARVSFEEARDNDQIVFRANKDILKVLEDLEENGELELVDTEKALVSEVPGGILGEPVIMDNAHLIDEGQARVARLLAEEIAQRDWIAPRGEWQFERQRPYEQIAGELGITPAFLCSVYLKTVNYLGSRFENRVRFARKALEIDPENVRALRYLAWTYWLMGKKDQAMETYRRLAAVDSLALQEVFQKQPDIREFYEAFDSLNKAGLTAVSK
jgi:tetratricopeptide (TPR) repeat protein